jgi:Fe-S-cluster-containing dehydrogenase component
MKLEAPRYTEALSAGDAAQDAGTAREAFDAESMEGIEGMDTLPDTDTDAETADSEAALDAQTLEVSHIAVKCDGCLDRVKMGKRPICVEACPLRALDFGDMVQLQGLYGSVNQIPPLPEPRTEPSLVIKPSPAAKNDKAQSGYVANTSEVV